MDDDDLRTGPRAALVAALRSVPPTTPTLCEGWQARHLAAHLVLREHAPWRIAAGMARGTDACREVGDTVTTLGEYEALVAQVAEGPGRFSPLGWSPAANAAEFVIHRLDVERGERVPSTPTLLGPATSRAIWRSTATLARLHFAAPAARGRVGLILVVPDGPRAVVARGEHSVVIRGAAAELALVAFGRQRASLATLGGDPSAVERFREATGWVS